MSAITSPTPTANRFPDSDGQPMADNTVQFEWIGLLMWNADAYFRDDPNVFVAGDHLIYAVEDENVPGVAPDVYVAFGRPKGHRGSYKVWEEGGVFPQVIFEVWSPSNHQQQMEDKRDFYGEHGAEEYYVIYPEFPSHVDGWKREGGKFVRVPNMDGFVSLRLGFRFVLKKGALTVFGPDGRQLRKPTEIAAERDQAEKRAEEERRRGEEARRWAEKLAAKLRELGLDPDAV